MPFLATELPALTVLCEDGTGALCETNTSARDADEVQIVTP